MQHAKLGCISHAFAGKKGGKKSGKAGGKKKGKKKKKKKKGEDDDETTAEPESIFDKYQKDSIIMAATAIAAGKTEQAGNGPSQRHI